MSVNKQRAQNEYLLECTSLEESANAFIKIIDKAENDDKCRDGY